ncbi:MAG: hypothetical protein LUD19_06740 [Clostridia bacterium]|nr:hypothetical protein [Clostridia bacterium]
MKKNKTKLLSAIVVLAMAGSSLSGVLSACSTSEETFGSDTGSTELSITGVNSGVTSYTVSSVFGSRTATTSGTTYYVSPDGSGTGTAADPADLMTLVNGSGSALEPGDTVILKDGTYTLTSTLYIYANGTYDQPITITAENAGQAILSCYGQGWGSRGVNLGGDFINFIGINVCGAGDNGMYLAGNYNLVENCEFYDNRDTGLQVGRNSGSTVDLWPSYNLIKNCTSHNNYDNQTYGENADGFAAKLTLGYGNVFDGCIAYRNSDDGWDLYAKNTSGNLGAVYIYNCVAFENGYLEYTQEESNARYGSTYDAATYNEANTNTYTTADGDGNGFKLGGEAMEGDVFVYNCLSFANRMHGFTDNSNPGYMSLKYCTAVDNGAAIDDDSTSDTFGQIICGGSGTHANYDLSRQDYSYNHLDHCLSLKTDMATGLVYDKYRGSVQDSIFYMTDASSLAKETSAKVEGTLDADSKNGIIGEDVGSLINAEDVFTKLNIEYTAGTAATETAEAVAAKYVYNISGKETVVAATETTAEYSSIHATYRNADGSINMGDLFAIKDQTKLLGDSTPIGATLNLTSYDAYTHYNMTDFTTYEDSVQVTLQAAKDMLYIQTDETAVYQDFDAVSKIYGCVVMWESSDESILKVSKTYTGSDLSKAEYVPIIVNRPDVDTEVKLTATIYYYGESITKEFTLNVIGDSPVIGDVIVIGPDGSELTNGQSIIVDKYEVLSDPEIIIYNSADYSDKVITEEQATFVTTYEFGEDIAALTSGESVEVANFTTAQDGAFKITMTVTLTVGENKGDSVSFTYYVLVASNTATITFLNDEYDVTVISTGYNISGSLSSAIGTIYSYSTTEALADENKTADYIMANGESYTFRTTTLDLDFTNANTGAYYIYTVFTNGNGEVTSKIYETQVQQVEISTLDDFYKLAQHVTETTSTVIYVLTRDLDFTDYTYSVTGSFSADTDGFKGLLNGNGYTISNITIDAVEVDKTVPTYVGIFRSLYGGTVTNINFDNISVTGYSDKIGGVFGSIIYGTVSDIVITNVSVIAGDSAQRVGALAGQIFSNNNAVLVTNVAVINDTSANEDGTYTYQIGGANATARVGALVGFAQTSSAQLYMDITITNCYVKAIVGGNAASEYIGGIVGRYDDRNGDGLDNLVITNCYSDGVIMGPKRTAGILGGGTGTGSLTVDGCVFVGTILDGSETVITASNSNNMSSVIGGYSSAVVTNIAAYFADRYYSSAQTTLTADSVKLEATWTALGFDLTIWVVDTTNGGLTLKIANS